MHFSQDDDRAARHRVGQMYLYNIKRCIKVVALVMLSMLIIVFSYNP